MHRQRRGRPRHACGPSRASACPVVSDAPLPARAANWGSVSAKERRGSFDLQEVPDIPAQVRYARRVLCVVALASILMGLNISTLNVALPEVVRHFEASSVAASWVLLSFMLAQTGLLLTFGRLTDMSGRRTMYLLGLSTFTVASILLGLAPTVWVLIALRVLQAAGSAMLLANSAALLTDVFPPRLLGQGMGIYIASFSVAQLIGPTFGGFLADMAGWRWVFWFNVPVGIAGLVLGAYILRDKPTRERATGLDLPGNVTMLIALTSLLIALSEVGQLGWTSPVVVGGFVLFAVFLPVFLLIERRHPHPLIDLDLFRQPSVAMPYFAGFANSAARFSMLVVVALFFQSVGGDDTFTAGLKVMPMAVATIAASSSLGLWTCRFSTRSVAVVGMATTVVGFVILYPALSKEASYVPILVAQLLIGFGSGIFMPANATAIMEALPSNRVSGIANATRLMIQNVGLVFGTAMSLTLISGLLSPAAREAVFAGTLTDVSATSVDELVAGYRHGVVFFLATCTLGLLSTILSRRTVGHEPRQSRNR